jgi:DNA-binding CsgD family transcriptional regulator
VGAIAAAEASAALDHARTVADTEALELALQAAGEAAKNEGRHLDALRHFRELRARSGASYLAEEIMALQLVDRYEHAQALLQRAHADDAGHIETALPSLLYAQLWQDFNLGRLDEAEAGAQTLIDLGQQIGTNMHALEAIMIRSAVSVLRGDPTTAALRLQAAATLTSADDNIRLPGLTLMRGWLAAVNGDIETALSALRPMLFTARESRTYWAWWPGWMSVFFQIGLAAGDADFTAEAVAIAELGAERNPGVASFEGLALNLRARLDADLGQLADAAKTLQTSPRPALRALGAETYGHALLAAGDRKAALHQLDQAWDEYDHMGAWAGRSGVQRLMREAGARPEKWTANPEAAKTGWPSLSEAEQRVAALIAAGHTNKSAAKTLGVSVNTVGTQLRSIFAKLGIQSRVQLANSLHENSASRPV